MCEGDKVKEAQQEVGKASREGPREVPQERRAKDELQRASRPLEVLRSPHQDPVPLQVQPLGAGR